MIFVNIICVLVNAGFIGWILSDMASFSSPGPLLVLNSLALAFNLIAIAGQVLQ